MNGQKAGSAADRAERRRIADRAATLLVALTRDPDENERAEIYRWIAERPEHAVAFAQAERSWRTAERLKALPESHPALDVAPPRAARFGGRSPVAAEAGARLSRRHVLGGGLLAASLAAGLAFPGVRSWLVGQDYATQVGERRDIRLADGSVMHLNTATRVRVRLSEHHRAIELLSGEAAFDVAHDRSRPFDVTVGALAVRAVGTRFAIRMNRDRSELTVTEGKVAVRRAEAVMGYVSAGGGAVLQGGRVEFARLDAASLERRTAWRSDLIELGGDTVEQAVAEFNRYREEPLVIGDPRVAGLRIGGRFDTRDSARFVAALQQSFPIRAVQRTDGATVLLYGGGAGATAAP